MRILYSFPHPIGAPGIGTTALHQVVGLLERGHDVTVIATSAHPGCPKLPKLISTMSIAGLRMPHRVMGMDRTMAYHDARVAHHLQRRPDTYDVVHCWPGGSLFTSRTASKIGIPALREVPNTHTENAYEVVGRLCESLGMELPPGSSHRSNAKRLSRERAEYDAAFRLLVPSAHVAETFTARGFAEERLLRHRYGFDPRKFKPPAPRAPGPLRALFLGGVGPRKGLHVALQAWAKSAASADGSFAIYGRMEAGYREVIEPYLKQSSVTVHDFTSDVKHVLQESDVLLLPSFEEGSALVTYEAQGCGVIPLVSEASGAMCTDGVTGLVHPTGDVDALAAHLDALAKDPSRRAEMERAVLAQRDALTWAAAAKRLESCYIEARAALNRSQQRRDLVFTFWHETWTDSSWREFMTPDRFAKALITHPDVDGLLLADPYRRGHVQFVRKLQGRRPAAAPERPYPTAVVSPLRLRRKDGIGEASLRRTYRAYDRALRDAAKKLGLRRPAIITTNPFYAAYGPLDWAGPVTYYAFDDWAAYDGHARWWPDYIRAYAEIRDRGHRVCAVSQPLLNRLDPTGPGLVVPNGIVPEEWQPPWRALEWAQHLPRPHILYTGAIHSRLDMAAVREVAARFPDGSLLFIGPTAHEDIVAELKAIPNVHLHGAVGRPEIAGLTRAVDVCIMPHLRNPLTESMSPLKIYEYCAAGRPCVATDILPVRNIHKQVVLVREGESFADAVEKALALGPMSEDDRQAFVNANSWRGRHDAILNLAFAE